MNIGDQIQNLRVGYGPLSQDLKEPGDRRRFCAYANSRNFDFEIADPSKDYDIVFLTYNIDIPAWIRYKKERGSQVKMVFELVDSYLFEPESWKSRLRGPANFLTGKYSAFYLKHKDAIREICRVSDAVACSTLEQKKALNEFNSNVHLSLDVFAGDLKQRKQDYKTAEKLKLSWEGQPYTIENLLSVKEVFGALKDKVELHLITDLEYFKFSKKYIKRPTSEILSSIDCDKHFHPWTRETFSRDIAQTDLAVIPINMDDSLARGKPENKLILLWMSGVPVLTSPTPSYARVMQRAGIDMMCASADEWKEKLLWYEALNAEERKNIADKAYDFAMKHYNEEALYAMWDELFASVLTAISTNR